jgi:energy-coupling factor transport system permease protein
MLTSYIGYIITAVYLLIVIWSSKIPIRKVVRSIKGIIFLIIFTAILNIFWYRGAEVHGYWEITERIRINLDGMIFAAMMASRIIMLVMGTTLLTLTTTPVALTDGIEKALAPLKLIKIPVHDIAIMMNIALRFIPAIMEETDKIILAQKARGANFDTGNIFQRAKAMLPILIPMLISSLNRAAELAHALDARCYNATPKRTKMKVLKYTAYDILGFLGILAYVGIVVADRLLIPILL